MLQKLMEELRVLDPERNYSRICEIGDTLFDADLFDEAKIAYEKLLPDGYCDDGPRSQELLDPDGWRLYEVGDFHEFTQYFITICSVSIPGTSRENTAWICRDLGCVFLEQKHFDPAEKMFRMAVALCPWEADLHEKLEHASRSRHPEFALMAHRRTQQLLGKELLNLRHT